VCWFVTLAVPSSSLADAKSVCELHRRGLQFNWLKSTPTTSVFPEATSCVQVTHGWCSCDIYSAPQKDSEDLIAKDRARLVNKGWSAAKVQRALASKAQSAIRPTAKSAAEADFRKFVAAIVREIGLAHLFAHMYSGDQHAEVVRPSATITLPLPSFASNGFPPDTVTTIRAAI
jgi:hypothetical protein